MTVRRLGLKTIVLAITKVSHNNISCSVLKEVGRADGTRRRNFLAG